MTDRVSQELRSRMMSAVRGKNTFPELFVRRKLHARGFRYRLHVKNLPGNPDIVLPRYRTVVFVHGCFWHGHSCSRGKRPSSNTKFWNTKIDANIQRDKRNQRRLRSTGWESIIVWECRLEAGTEKLIRRLASKRFAINGTA